MLNFPLHINIISFNIIDFVNLNSLNVNWGHIYAYIPHSILFTMHLIK